MLCVYVYLGTYRQDERLPWATACTGVVSTLTFQRGPLGRCRCATHDAEEASSQLTQQRPDASGAFIVCIVVAVVVVARDVYQRQGQGQ